MSKQNAKLQTKFVDDLMYLKHLDKVSFVNTLAMKDNKFKTKILNKTSNHKVCDPKQATYYVGFPSVTKRYAPIRHQSGMIEWIVRTHSISTTFK